MAATKKNSSTTQIISKPNERVAIVGGVRTPFAKAWTVFQDWSEVDLGREAIVELVNRTEIDPHTIDEVIVGCVSVPMDGPNVGREIILRSQIPNNIPATTVQMYCASSAYAALNACAQITSSVNDVMIAGGVESMSSMRARLSNALTHALKEAGSSASLSERFKAFTELKPRDLMPHAPSIKEPTTGLSMGEAAEEMAKHYDIAREDQDNYAYQSHRRAAKAYDDDKFPEVMPLLTGPRLDSVVAQDTIIRRDSSVEKMAALNPVFDTRYGTVTAANSSPLTDGASMVMLMRESTAKEFGLEPWAYIRSFATAAIDITQANLLLGPTFATPQALKRAGIKFEDIDLIEMHEAFAAQTLANLKIWRSKSLCHQLGLDSSIGDVDMDRFNVNGGSIPIGHPFGATGTRIIMQLAGEMRRRDKNLGLLTLCAAGGLGLSMVLER